MSSCAVFVGVLSALVCLASATPPETIFMARSSDLISKQPTYLMVSGFSYAALTEKYSVMTLPVDCGASRLQVNLDNQSARTFTLRQNGQDTRMACRTSATGGGDAQCSYAAPVVRLHAGDNISIKVDGAGDADPAKARISFVCSS